MAAFLAAPALAQESPAAGDDDEVMFISSVSIGPGQCNIDKARPMTLQAARRHPARLDRTCVAVRGWWRGRALFSEAPVPPEFDRGHIGLYGDWDVLGQPPAKAVRVVAVGELSACAALKASQPGTLLGYCHNVDGPVLILSQIVR